MEEIGPEEYWRTAADYGMKYIGAEWRNLAEGLLRIEALEAQVRAEWALQLEMARRAAEEAGRQRNRRLRRAGLIAALVLALLLLTVSFVLRFAPANAAALGLLIAASAMAVFYGLGVYLDTLDTLPDPPNLTDRWWNTISGRTSSVRRWSRQHPTGSRRSRDSRH